MSPRGRPRSSSVQICILLPLQLMGADVPRRGGLSPFPPSSSSLPVPQPLGVAGIHRPASLWSRVRSFLLFLFIRATYEGPLRGGHGPANWHLSPRSIKSHARRGQKLARVEKSSQFWAGPARPLIVKRSPLWAGAIFRFISFLLFPSLVRSRAGGGGGRRRRGRPRSSGQLSLEGSCG
eukprot:9503995-Pyramimonas_sp.AAC.4